MFNLKKWIDIKLKRGTYVLKDGLILKNKGRKNTDFLDISKIISWSSYDDPWSYIVEIELENGESYRWIDPYFQLEAILQSVAQSKFKTK